MNITVIGLGHVGLVHAAAMAAIGHDVIGIDSDRARIATLLNGEVPFHEPGLSEEVHRQRRAGRLEFTNDPHVAYSGSEVAFICVGTPALPNGKADLSAVEAAARELERSSAPGGLVVVEKSTVPPGTHELLRRLLRADMCVASNPEFLREGTAMTDTLNPDRIVVGTDEAFADAVMRDVYSTMTDSGTRYVATSVATAELAKHACNSFLATKISFINAIANLCDAVGADVSQVAGVMGSDPRIGPDFLEAGLGYGGFCFPKDVAALSETFYDHGIVEASLLLQQVQRINRGMIGHVIAKLTRYVGLLPGSRVAVLGLAFKPGTDDTRYSPAVSLARTLERRGARVSTWDPKVRNVEELHAKPYPDIYNACRGAKAIILATEWDDIHRMSFARLADVMDGTTIIDARNMLSDSERSRAAAAGLSVIGVGQGEEVPACAWI